MSSPQGARLAASWRRYLRFWGARSDADFDDELRFHFDMRVSEYVSRGLSDQQARAAALERLGNVEAARAECVALSRRRERSVARARVADSVAQDVRFALRSFARQKGWTTVAVLTLALGIGANTAMFSVVNRLLLDPLPYPGADRIALVNLQPTEKNSTGVNVSIAPSARVARAWMEGARSLEALEPYGQSDAILSIGRSPPSQARVAMIQASFLGFTGHQVLRGRMFTRQEVAAKAPVALLAEGAWRSKFGEDTTIVGRTIRLNDRTVSIIGVAPSALTLPRHDNAPPDVWMPLDLGDDQLGPYMVARLRPGMSFAAAARELDSLVARAEAGSPEQGKFRASIISPRELVQFDDALVMLMGAVAVVLLIACVNVAHLLLARSATRSRELAIRAALGAGRARLFRQLLTETTLLAVFGCAGGFGVCWLMLNALVATRPESLAALSAVEMDGTVLLVTISLSILTGLGFGILASLNASRQATPDSLKAGSPGLSHSRRQQRVRSLLVVSEMALSAMLLVGATLLVRSVIHLYRTDPGFDPHALYSVRPVLPSWRYTDASSRDQFYAQLIERVRSFPGVSDVALSASVPPGFNFLIGAMQLEGEPPPEPGLTSLLRTNAVSQSYFRTMRLAIVEGRGFSDSVAASNEILVNRGFAKKHWPSSSAVGRRLNIIGWGGKGTWYTVVGVVEDAAMGGLTHDRTSPLIYTTLSAASRASIVVRARPGTDALSALRAINAGIDPELPPPTLRNIEEAMHDTAAEPRFMMLVLASFTGLALLLAAVGLYGVMAYAVAQRTREIGIRMALGASRREISRDVVGGGVALAVTGVIAGLGAAVWASRGLEAMLYGVTRNDVTSFAVSGLVLLTTALLACVVPMRRAASVDPLIAMRTD